MKICSVEDCPKTVLARGWCRMHYGRWSIHGTPLKGGKGYKNKVQVTADGLRVCKLCAEAKPFADFHKDKNGTDGYRAQCKPCRNAYMVGYHEENRDARVEYIRERRINEGDHIRALEAARYERHRDKRIELATEHSHLRRARMKEVEHERGITVHALRKIHGDNCCYCGIGMDFVRGERGTIAPARATLEHIMPISRGGSHTWSNAALACHRCNTSKNARTVDEWSPTNGDIANRDSGLEART